MRLYIALAAALALAGLLYWEVGVHKRAAQADAAEARADEAEAGRAADMREVVKRLDRDAEQRGALIARMGGIEKRFGDIVIPKPEKLIQKREVPGEACPVIGVNTDYVSLYNRASAP